MSKPQDVPAGQNQMIFGVALNLITYIVALAIIYGADGVMLHALIDVGATGLLLYGALRVCGMLPRFEQAFGALCGASAFLNLAAIPLLYPSQLAGGGASIGFYLLLVWSFSLTAHVLRHTFGIHMIASIGVAVLYYIFINSLLAMIWPPTDTAAVGDLSWQLDLLANTVLRRV